MTKSRIVLFVFIISATIILYLLPRYVVNNDAGEMTSPTADAASTADTQISGHVHNSEIPDSVQALIDSFYDSFKNAENQEKRFIFADSLAKAYKTVGKLDSLAKYSEVRALVEPNLSNNLKAGDGYYEAFNFAVDPSKRNTLAEKARVYYQRVLEENSTMLDVKAKLAMTYVSGEQPMTGIMMLREVLEQDATNEMAIYNLGILAITSGQLDKAIERFTKLKELNPESMEANFYLGYCLFETGKVQESKAYFEKVKELGVGDLVFAAEDYLEKISK